ncbi:hypothetical protein Vadar_010958 [Vaccinium darrowii]|uniref:Uncharacterized protein n=1 Tax=Vaccinium darrowii TaxID=229202 RepID=A0ACB7XGX1_9ERIC|nr:hypothetical protein Vadar_010958 [Vaccinium darrowii]
MYYFAPESPLQGESRNELETLNLDELETLNYSFVTSDSTNGDNLENSGEGTDEASGHILNDGNSLDQMEEVQPPPVPASPCQSVPLNQLLSQSDSIPESQVHSESSSSIPESHVNSEPHIKMLPNRVTRGKPRVNYEPVLDSKPRPKQAINPDYDWAKQVKEFEDTKAGVKGLVDSGITTLPRFLIHPPESVENPPQLYPLELPTVDLEGCCREEGQLNGGRRWWRGYGRPWPSGVFFGW